MAMEGYQPETYGDRIAAVYDQFCPASGAEEAASFLADLASGGPALELAIGTGRVALPLAARGVRVEGIDISEAMVGQLRAKPGGENIPVAIGDFADVGVDGTYSLIYVVFNTFFALVTQERQIECFANVAAHLAPGGSFVVEAFVPDLTRFRNNSAVSAIGVDVEMVRLDATHHDPISQRVDSAHIHITQAGIQLYPVSLRYAYPPELDLMGRLAGLRLEQRWDGWQRQPYTTTSPMTVSVYRR